MPYNEEIDQQITELTKDWENTDRKKMFGGTCRLVNGNMYCGVYKDYLILRLGKEKADAALRQDFTSPFDITGRPMKGWVMVERDGFKTDEELKKWLESARDFAMTLPPK